MTSTLQFVRPGREQLSDSKILDQPVVALTRSKISIILQSLLEPFQLSVADGLDIAEDHPVESFAARRLCKTARVVPAFQSVEGVHKGLDIDSLWFLVSAVCFGSVNDLPQEGILVIAAPRAVEKYSQSSVLHPERGLVD